MVFQYILANGLTRPGESLLNLCYHGAQGACLVLQISTNYSCKLQKFLKSVKTSADSKHFNTQKCKHMIKLVLYNSWP